MKMKVDKNSLVVIIMLLVMTIGFTLAYFATQVFGDLITKLDIVSKSMPLIIFNKGDDLYLKVGIENFYEGAGNFSSSTYPSVTISSDSAVRDGYNLYFNIETNNFMYTTDDETAELILSIYDEKGEEITEIEGLEYVTVSGVSGFDVTTKTGEYEILLYKTITTYGGDVTHEWEFKLTFVNLDTDQLSNMSKNFRLLIDMHQGVMVYNQPTGEFAYNVLLNNGGADFIYDKGIPDFSVESITNDGMYATEDAYGTSYYFRGAVDNNWVRFADTYWRIVRINGDGSVRLIYSGTTAPTKNDAVVMTGGNTQIGTSAFNSTTGSAEYGGYMYTLGEAHGLSTDSTIKEYIDDYYESELLSYSDYIADTIYCFDRTGFSDTSGLVPADAIGNSYFEFGFYQRYSQYTPSVICSDSSDNFTVNSEYGNEALTYPIGMLSGDEMLMAGVKHGSSSLRANNYIATDQDVWLGTGSRVNSSSTLYIRFIDDFVGNSNGNIPTSSFGVRPVISLEADLSIKGSGTYDDPYIVLGTNSIYIESIEVIGDSSYSLNVNAYDLEYGIKGYKLIGENETCTTDNLVNTSINFTFGTNYKLCVYNSIGDLLEEDFSLKYLSDSIFLNEGSGYSSVSEAVSAINAKTPYFTGVSTTDEGLNAIADNDGTSYYFRGTVDNNWVKFAGFYWRIVRIEGTGAIKLIYSGTVAPTSSQSVVMTGSGTYISNSTFQDKTLYLNDGALLSESAEGVGYVYEDSILHGTTNDSKIKTAVDTWYSTNLSSYSNYLTTSNYCIDRVTYTRSGSSGSYTFTKTSSQIISTYTHYYGAYSRLYLVENESPSLECEDSGDVLSLNVGMISADELSLAGGLVGTINSSFYLYTNSSYWTLSPFYVYGSSSSIYMLGYGSTGLFGTGNISSNTLNIRPTISLKSTVSIISGNGEWDNPYIID